MRVRLARLIAERDGLDQPQMPHELANRSGDNEISRLWVSEIALFNSRAATRRNAKELLQSHVGQLGEQISGLDAQVKSKAAQHDLISGELEGVDSLYQKGLVPLSRKTSLQREAARLDGERGQVVAAIAEAKSKISEAELQAIKIDQEFRTEVMKDLREAQDKVAELVEKRPPRRTCSGASICARRPTGSCINFRSIPLAASSLLARSLWRSCRNRTNCRSKPNFLPRRSITCTMGSGLMPVSQRSISTPRRSWKGSCRMSQPI